jgi:pimeloyl-ACP methyl ester carboxylesterase
VLIPGSGGAATRYRQRVVPLLRDAGHEAVPVDLPGADPAAGLPEYARLAAAAVGGHPNAVLVARSLGAFTAPMAAAQSRVAQIVLVNAMIPEPGGNPRSLAGHAGQPQAQAAAARRGHYSTTFDLHTYFQHDVPADIAATGQDWPEEDAVFESACDFRAWPPVPVQVVAGVGDRLFPLGFQQRLARDRLGSKPTSCPAAT